MTTSNFSSTAYSSFFSSGLLAAHTPRRHRRSTVSSDASSSWADVDSPPQSPATSSSPAHPHIQFAMTSMDVDSDDVDMLYGSRHSTPLSRRSATPTPATVGGVASSKAPVKNANVGAPRLRRRRSSLSAVPAGNLKTPVRAAGHALQVQRARSGSLGGDVGLSSLTLGNDVSGCARRSRSGSFGTAAATTDITGRESASRTTVTLRPRRAVRRIAATFVPGPRAPPPTAPLPALPLTPTPGSAPVMYTHSSAASQDTTSTQLQVHVESGSVTPTPGHPQPSVRTSARARGLSVSASTMDGVEHRIEEVREH